MAVVASAMGAAARTTSHSAISPLGAAFIGAGIVIVALILVIALWWYLRPTQRRERRQARKALARPATTGGVAQLAAARAAYERGDYRRVVLLLTDNDGNIQDDLFPNQLLLAAACDELGSDERSIQAFRAAVAVLLADQSNAITLVDRSSPAERLIFADMVRRFPDLAGQAAEYVNEKAPAQEAESQLSANFLARLRQRVVGQCRAAERRSRNYRLINIILGAAAALAAAGAGFSGASKSPTLLIELFALVSAALSTILITLKPAETAESADKTAKALTDLAAEIELFEMTGKDHDAEDIRNAVTEVQHRLSAAKNRPRLVPLETSGAPSLGGVQSGGEAPLPLPNGKQQPPASVP